MKAVKYFILFFLLPFSTQAQKQSNNSPASFITRFPFKMYSGGVMIIRACFENVKDSLNFILDTGSGGISLDSSTCSEFNIEPTLTDTILTGIAGTQKASFVFGKSLTLPGLKIERLNFHVSDYSVLSSVYGEKVDGIIGYSFFNRYIVKINFDALEVEVYSAGRMRYPVGGITLHPIFTFLPVEKMQVKDRRKIDFNFYFDTGAGLCFLMSEQFAGDSSVVLPKRKPVITQAEGMGGKMRMRLTVVKEVKLGPYRFYQVPTYLYQDIYKVTSYPFSGGLVGNNLLKRFNMIINYPQREIQLTPNTHFNELFEYGYTGFSIYLVNEKIIVDDIIKDSPADKAGFKVDDEIISVANNHSNNIQQYKDILQEPNAHILVTIKRKEQFIPLILKTTSIL